MRRKHVPQTDYPPRSWAERVAAQRTHNPNDEFPIPSVLLAEPKLGRERDQLLDRAMSAWPTPGRRQARRALAAELDRLSHEHAELRAQGELMFGALEGVVYHLRREVARDRRVDPPFRSRQLRDADAWRMWSDTYADVMDTLARVTDQYTPGFGRTAAQEERAAQAEASDDS